MCLTRGFMVSTVSRNFEFPLLCPASEDKPRVTGMASGAEVDLAAKPTQAGALESATLETIVANLAID